MPKASLHPAEHHDKHRSFQVIRNVYLYLVSMIGLITFIIGCVGITNNVLMNFVFQVNESDYFYVSPLGTGPCDDTSMLKNADPNVPALMTRTPEEIKKCEERLEQQNQQQMKNRIGREFSISLAQIVVGLPVWLFHWMIIQREYRRKEKKVS
jgi:hypothetical protein